MVPPNQKFGETSPSSPHGSRGYAFVTHVPCSWCWRRCWHQAAFSWSSCGRAPPTRAEPYHLSVTMTTQPQQLSHIRPHAVINDYYYSTPYQTALMICVWGSRQVWFRRCDMLCTSGFMDDVTFSYHGASGPEWSTTHDIVFRIRDKATGFIVGKLELEEFTRWQYQFDVRQLQCLIESVIVRHWGGGGEVSCLRLHRLEMNHDKALRKSTFVCCLTSFCRSTETLALMRMQATPAWPYRTAVCRAVSPHCKQTWSIEVDDLSLFVQRKRQKMPITWKWCKIDIVAMKD